MPTRDRPRFEHSERVDLPDMAAVMRGERVSLYHTLATLLFGDPSCVYPG